MIVEFQPNGDFILDGAELGDRFGLSERDFHRYMKLGLIRGTVEVGTGEDEGTRRLSLRLGNRMWRAVLNADNSIRHEEMTFLRGKPPKRQL
ncbi:DUF6522 family protein [Rhizobium sp. LC145]|jgi:hypothetical protein|uniref:DUF6522 family protein n=1 Tax=Rhizobium sp. LC145 TaxID=1120688 RepID=UPI00062A2C75|nr:DUF6522 family protein [Rhizobium sp. LC145]KKX33118.1 hypothetical protein YH62_06190 [Rhizobium sp. LC145]TKT68722.1 hypothetical protein FDR95_02065 [Rhizobiaceae bacterium LC148]